MKSSSSLSLVMMLFVVATSISVAGQTMRPANKFGAAAACAGDVNNDGFADLIIGAEYWENGESREGAAFAFYGTATGFSSLADWQVESDAANALFGAAVASAGDLNGDGFDDVVVGAPDYDEPTVSGNHEGWAAVYYGSAAGLSTSPDWFVSGTQANGRFGRAVSAAGDLDNDGYDDLLVAAPWHSDGESFEGHVFVYLGSSEGDLDNDGHDDIIVGAPSFGANSGRIFIFLGSVAGIGTSPRWHRVEYGGSEYGFSVAGAGDVNSDGFDDVLIGDWTKGTIDAFYGPSLFGFEADWTVSPGTGAGASVAGAGDVNGDGFDDVIIGNQYWGLDEGVFYIYYGGESGLSTSSAASEPGGVDEIYFGHVVAGAGDVDNDGFDDVVIGNCPVCTVGTQVILERAVVYRGSTSGVTAEPPEPLAADVVGPAGRLGATLRLRRNFASTEFTWQPAECHEGILDYVLYQGTLGDFTSHVPVTAGGIGTECTTSGSLGTFVDDFYAPGDTYYLLVPRKTDVEGSYGLDSRLSERPASLQPCVPQSISTCATAP